MQCRGRYMGPVVEAGFQVLQVHHLILRAEDRIVEADLGHAAKQREHAAFIQAALAPARSRAFTLTSTAGGLAPAAALASADALAFLVGPGFGRNLGYIHHSLAGG